MPVAPKDDEAMTPLTMAINAVKVNNYSFFFAMTCSEIVNVVLVFFVLLHTAIENALCDRNKLPLEKGFQGRRRNGIIVIEPHSDEK